MMLSACSFAQTIKKNTDFGYSRKVKRAHYINEFKEHVYRSFDKSGRLTEIYSNDHEGPGIIPVLNDTLFHTIKYIYAKDQLIERKHFFDDTLRSIDKLSYNGNDLIYDGYFSVSESGIELKSEHNYIYENKKLKLKEEFQYYNDSNYYRTEYTYDDASNLQVERDYDKYNKPSNNFKKIYTNKKSKIIEVWATRHGNIELLESEEFIYDHKGNTIKYIEEQGNSRDFNLYFFKNNIISRSEYYSKGKLLFEKYYDLKGNVTLIKRYEGRNELIEYKNTYNKEGDLVVVEWFEYGYHRRKTTEYEYWD